MRELAALQAKFGAGLDARIAEAGGADIFVGEADQVRHRLGIYRGNTAANAAKALGAAYPIIGKIVGADFFSGLASEYRWRFPSDSGDLNDYGGSFAAFLAEFPPAKEMPYLEDVARLEWRVHRAHYAADPQAFDPARLAAVPPEHQMQLCPRLHPACTLVRSMFPIVRIWDIHQETFSGAFDVDFTGSPTNALVYRPRFRVEVGRISDAQAAFLGAALDGQTLDAALAAAQSREASFDLACQLADWVHASVIVDFRLDGE